MNFDDMINEYDSYVAELKNFKSYLLSDNPIINNKILGGIRTEHIIESIEYNIEHNDYNSKSIASKYAIGIAQFFRYATSNNWFSNDNIIQEINMYKFDDNSYYSKISAFIKKNDKLANKQSKDTCTTKEVAEIITTIDSYFAKAEAGQQKLSYSKVCCMLAVKLILLTGAKYSIIRNLEYDDLNIQLNTLRINGFNIRLPINLSKQFQVYNKLRSETIPSTSNYLFTSQEGKQWGTTTNSNGLTDILLLSIMRLDTTGITKYGISNLIKAGVGIKEIEKLSGAGSDLIRSCMDIDPTAEENKLNNYINMCMANTESYYIL